MKNIQVKQKPTLITEDEYNLNLSSEDDNLFKEQESYVEEDMEIIMQEEVSAANFQTEYRKGRTYVSFVLDDDTEVVLATPLMKHIQAQDRFIKNRTQAGNLDAGLYLIKECCEKWGSKTRAECNAQKGEEPVTMLQLSELSQYDFFRIAEGFSRVQVKRRSK